MEDITMKKNEETITVDTGIETLNNDTELVFIIDRSGSMSGFESDTAGGFNSMIEKQKANGTGTVYVSTVVFDNYSEVVHDRVPIMEVERMTPEDCGARGCTALYDAIGGAIKHIGNVHKYARREDVPAHTIFVITTDGMENASHNFTGKQVKEMIKDRTEKYGWEFIFVAANIDAADAAGDIGIRAERTANYVQCEEGIKACYEAMDNFVTMKRSNPKIMCSDTSWRGDLEKNEKKSANKIN